MLLRILAREENQTMCFHHSLVPLPLFRCVPLFQILRILIAQLIVRVLDRLFDPLFTAQADDRADTLLDTPCCRDTRHANVVLLCDFLYATDDLLIDLIFTCVDEVLQELVGLRTVGGAVGPGAGEGATGDGGPGDKANACVLTVWDLRAL